MVVVPAETPDVLLARQLGLLSRAQAISYGHTDSAIRARLVGGRWQRVHRHVYAVTTGALGFEQRVWAAVLYAGDGAVASHLTAARLWGFDEPGTEGALHVTVSAARRVRSTPGLVIHRSRAADAAGHPVRLPPRSRVEPTVLDLVAAARSLDQAMAWIARACQHRLTTPHRLREAAAARPRLRWRGDLELALADVDAGAHSLLELRYLRDVERRHCTVDGP